MTSSIIDLVAVGYEVSETTTNRARFIQPCTILGQQPHPSLHARAIFFYVGAGESRNIEPTI